MNHPDRHTVSFLCTLSRMSGGRYLPLAEASNLPTILLGGAEEEVELAKFEKMMDEEEELVLKQAKEKGEVLGEEEVSKRVAANLAKKEVKVTQLQVSRCGGGEFWQKQEVLLFFFLFFFFFSFFFFLFFLFFSFFFFFFSFFFLFSHSSSRISL